MMEMTKLLLLCSGIVAGVALLVVLFAFDSLRRFCDRRFGCGGWGIAELDAERAIQAQVDEAVEGKTKEQVQLERREWYERYLKPFTRTLTESDLSGTDVESDEEEGGTRISIDEKHDIEPECQICFATYQAGDAVVVSKDCRHAFCEACVLEWLSLGKKRCPLCREWFVPPEPIVAMQKKMMSSSGTIDSDPVSSEGEGSV